MYNTKIMDKKDTFKFTKLITVLALLISLSSFGLYACKPEQKIEPPEPLAEKYLDFVKNGEIEKATALYSDKMFSVVPKKNWLKSLTVYRYFYGKLKSYELQYTKQVKNDSKEFGGIYSYLVYKVEYDKQANQEVFTIRQPAGGGALELAGHYMNVEIVEPEKLMERIFSEQSGKVASQQPPVISKPAADKTVVKTMRIEELSKDAKNSVKEKETKKEE